MKFRWNQSIESELNELRGLLLNEFGLSGSIVALYRDTQHSEPKGPKLDYLMYLSNDIERLFEIVSNRQMAAEINTNDQEVQISAVVTHLNFVAIKVSWAYENESLFAEDENWLTFLRNVEVRIKQLMKDIDKKGLIYED